MSNGELSEKPDESLWGNVAMHYNPEEEAAHYLTERTRQFIGLNVIQNLHLFPTLRINKQHKPTWNAWHRPTWFQYFHELEDNLFQ